jgi:hypothetical protein
LLWWKPDGVPYASNCGIIVWEKNLVPSEQTSIRCQSIFKICDHDHPLKLHYFQGHLNSTEQRSLGPTYLPTHPTNQLHVAQSSLRT